MDKQRPHEPGEQQYKEKAREHVQKSDKREQEEQLEEAGISNRPLSEELHRQEHVPPSGHTKK